MLISLVQVFPLWPILSYLCDATDHVELGRDVHGMSLQAGAGQTQHTTAWDCLEKTRQAAF